MIEPAKYNLNLYKGVDFTLNFRIKIDGINQVLTDWDFTFKASTKANGTLVFDYATGQSPAHITIDADDDTLAIVSIDATETDIDHDNLYYELDSTSPEGEVARRLYGTINVPRTVVT